MNFNMIFLKIMMTISFLLQQNDEGIIIEFFSAFSLSKRKKKGRIFAFLHSYVRVSYALCLRSLPSLFISNYLKECPDIIIIKRGQVDNVMNS